MQQLIDLYYRLIIVALVLAAAMAVLVSWRRRRLRGGLSLLLVTAVLAPLETVGSRLNVPVLLTVLLCGGWTLQHLSARRRVGLGSTRASVAGLTFMGVAALSFVVGQYPWFPTAGAPMQAQIGGLAMFLLSAGLFLVVGSEVRSPAHLERLTWLFVGTGFVAVLMSFVPAWDLKFGRFAITDTDSIGSMFWTWLVAVSVSQGLCNRDLSPLARLVALAVGVGALLRGLFWAFSWASGWLPPLVALGVILLIRFPRATVCGALLLVAPALALGAPAYHHLMAGESYSSMTRVQALTVMWHIIQRNPWLGFGPANYYHYTLLFPILGWWVRFNSHNNYVDLVAQTGVVGLLAFCWLVAEVLRLAWRLRSRVTTGFGSAYLTGVVGGIGGSLAAGMLADWIVPFAYNLGLRGFRSSLLFWFFLGGVLVLNRTVGSAEAPVAVDVKAMPVWRSGRRVRAAAGAAFSSTMSRFERVP
jgi:hypothetical protein